MMYKSNLHSILVDTMEKSKWIRSTRDEDNFRQVICSALYQHISPNCVEIPSTRSGHGDIKIFGRKIEIKYAGEDKVEDLKNIIADYELVCEKKVEFSIVSIRISSSPSSKYMHSFVSLPMLAKSNASPNFGKFGTGKHQYLGISIFLSATYPHNVTTINQKLGKGKNPTAYLSFENSTSIERSVFLETPYGLIHVDTIGCSEDGMISFLFKHADVTLQDIPGSNAIIEIPYTPNPIKMADFKRVNVLQNRKKLSGNSAYPSTIIEHNVPCYKIY